MEVIPEKLYRGSKLHGSQYQRISQLGLMIAGAHGGLTNTIYINDLIELIKKHVDVEIDSNKYHAVSDFLSFTSKINTARYYAFNDHGKRKIHSHSFDFDYSNQDYDYMCTQTDFNESKFYIAQLGIPENIKEISQGVFEFSYEIDIDHYTYNFDYLNQQNRKCIVLMFDLKKISKEGNFKTTIQERIEKDDEWLLLPYDLHRQTKRGKETTIYYSEFLKINYYKRI